MAVEALPLIFSLLGGLFMGSYPVPIKSGRVLALAPHPIAFQAFKSFWVFLTGWLFLLGNGGAGFQFSWWAVISAFCWVPSGLCTIFVVPRIGMGLAVVTAAGANSLLSFLVFWLAFGAPLRRHGFVDPVTGAGGFFLAPFYLFCLLLGMAALVAVPRLQAPCSRGRLAVAREEAAVEEPGASEEQGPCFTPEPRKERAALRVVEADEVSPAGFAVGVAGALLGGSLSAAQMGVASKARSLEEEAAGCAGDRAKCPPELLERFNNAGSWMASFGIGTALATVVCLGAFFAVERIRQRPRPALHLRALLVPGSVGGLCWVLGNFFQLAAVMSGGPTIMAATNNCFQFLTSGAWGLLYYREVRGAARIVLWILAAAWTVTAALLLSREKAQ